MMATKAFKYKQQAIKDSQPSMNVAGVPAWLGDTFVSADEDKRICAGFFRLEKGNALVYDYDYEEMKIIVEGEFVISDETGQKVTGKPGDVFYFPLAAVLPLKPQIMRLVSSAGSVHHFK